MLLFIPVLLGVCPLIGYFLGWLLDRIFHTDFLYIIFIFVGLGAAARETYLIVRRVYKNTNE